MSRAESEATAWLDKMMGPDAGAHRAAFDAWHDNPANARAYAEAKDNWAYAADMSRARIEADVRADQRSREPGGFRWAFATILVALIAGVLAWQLLGSNGDRPIVATIDTQGESQLADETRVTLTDGAEIETLFTDSERRVILRGGRARFEVAHDAARPFLVEAGGSLTRALGTIFEVDLRHDVPRIALVEGSVEVRRRDGGAALRLSPGQRAEVRSTGPRRVAEEQASAPAPSPANTLWAEDLPLGAILDRANRENGVHIALADPSLASLKVTGRFDMTQALPLARKLAAALQLEVDVEPDGPSLRKSATAT
ncbi:FecR family protein [Sphingopyxis sp.]|uniref:FecR family protein n=1 Tax=Sphingopyxis sp. TaxID=1908224 RepID=UPI0035B342BF